MPITEILRQDLSFQV